LSDDPLVIDRATTKVPLRPSVDRYEEYVLAVALGFIVDQRPAHDYVVVTERHTGSPLSQGRGEC